MPDPQPPLDLAAAADPAASFAAAHREGRPLALRTSGTANRPRVLLRSTGSWLDSFPAFTELTGMSAGDSVWIPGPLTATMNLFATVHAGWLGARVVPDLAGAGHAHLTPARLATLVATRPADLAGVAFVTAGDHLTAALHGDAVRAGAKVSHYYGAAELSFVAWGSHAEALRPFPGVEVEPREGELWVRSPFVATEYADGENLLRRDAGGWTTVGDRGEVAEGRVVVHGRAGGITTGGATVRIGDIEATLRPAARGSVVVAGIPHAHLGEVVVAVLTEPADLGPLRDLARTRLEAAQRPRRWYHLDPLPLTDNHKVDRVAVRGAVSAGDGATPLT